MTAQASKYPLGTGRASTPNQFASERSEVKKIAVRLDRVGYRGKQGATQRKVIVAFLRTAHASGTTMVEKSGRLLADEVGAERKTVRRAIEEWRKVGVLEIVSEGRYRYRDGTAKGTGSVYRIHVPPRRWWDGLPWVTPQGRTKPPRETLSLPNGLLGVVVRTKPDPVAPLCRGVLSDNGWLLLECLDSGQTFDSPAAVQSALHWKRDTTRRNVGRLVQLELAIRESGVLRRGPARIEELADRLGARERAARQRHEHDRDQARRFVQARARGDTKRLEIVDTQTPRRAGTPLRFAPVPVSLLAWESACRVASQHAAICRCPDIPQRFLGRLLGADEEQLRAAA